MAAGIDTYKALRPFSFNGKRVRRGGKLAFDMRDPRVAKKVATLVETRWITLQAVGTGASKGAS